MKKVYVIEIDPRWHGLVAEGLADGAGCFYVGQTGKAIPLRFREHLDGASAHPAGRDLSARVFRRIREANGGEGLERGDDAVLRFDLYEGLPALRDEAAAEAAEAETIDRLRREGHCVYPEGRGGVPFDSFRNRR